MCLEFIKFYSLNAENYITVYSLSMTLHRINRYDEDINWNEYIHGIWFIPLHECDE